MEKLFYEYLLEGGLLEYFLDKKKDYENSLEHIRKSQEELKTGIIWNHGEAFTFKKIVNTDGSPAYSSYEEWEQDVLDYIKQEQEYADYDMELMMDEIEEYNAYCEKNGKDTKLTYEQVWTGEIKVELGEPQIEKKPLLLEIKNLYVIADTVLLYEKVSEENVEYKNLFKGRLVDVPEELLYKKVRCIGAKMKDLIEIELF